jgi:uncharacterized membrane protein (DUF106 family)
MKIFFIIIAAILGAFAIWFGGKAVVDQNARTQNAHSELQDENAKAAKRIEIIKQLERK